MQQEKFPEGMDRDAWKMLCVRLEEKMAEWKEVNTPDEERKKPEDVYAGVLAALRLSVGVSSLRDFMDEQKMRKMNPDFRMRIYEGLKARFMDTPVSASDSIDPTDRRLIGELENWLQARMATGKGGGKRDAALKVLAIDPTMDLRTKPVTLRSYMDKGATDNLTRQIRARLLQRYPEPDTPSVAEPAAMGAPVGETTVKQTLGHGELSRGDDSLGHD